MITDAAGRQTPVPFNGSNEVSQPPPEMSHRYSSFNGLPCLWVNNQLGYVSDELIVNIIVA